MRTRSGCSRSNRVRRWRRCRASSRPRSTTSSSGGDHPAGPDRGADGASVSEPARGPGSVTLSAPVARTDPHADARRAVVPGAVTAHRDGGGRVHRRTGRGSAPCDGLQAIRAPDEGDRSAAARRDGAAGITGAAADEIIRSIVSFALYGFPESHAASFALLAYASAYLKVHYPAAFYTALLNNQPMGFYHPSTLVKDAQRRGVRFTRSTCRSPAGSARSKPTARSASGCAT